MYGSLKQIYKVFFWRVLRSSGPDGGSNRTNDVNDSDNVEGSMFKLARWKISFLKWPLSDCHFFFLFFFHFFPLVIIGGESQIISKCIMLLDMKDRD